MAGHGAGVPGGSAGGDIRGDSGGAERDSDGGAGAAAGAAAEVKEGFRFPRRNRLAAFTLLLAAVQGLAYLKRSPPPSARAAMSTPIASHQAPPGGRPLSPQAQAELDAARIGEEILGRDDGTDPFVAAVRATRMPMIITNPRIGGQSGGVRERRLLPAHRLRTRGDRRAQLPLPAGAGDRTPPPSREISAKRCVPCRPIEIDIRNHRKDGTHVLEPAVAGARARRLGAARVWFFASQVDVTLERERLAGLETHNAALLAELGGPGARAGGQWRPACRVPPPRPGGWASGNWICSACVLTSLAHLQG